MKIKSILVSQPKPENDKSPYFELAKKYNLKIDFRPFIQVEGITTKEFRSYRVNILEHTAIIFTSRTAIDHFFKIVDDLKVEVPDTMKYFCISESISFYLQKYTVYRKRKIFYGSRKFIELLDIIKKFPDEKYLLPVSDIHKQEIPNLLKKEKINFTKVVLYRTVSSDLSDLSDVNYDLLVFFSPSGIKSLLQNFPEFKQNKTLIASFGPTTAKAVKKAGLNLNVPAPQPNAPSMTMAIENYIKKEIKLSKKKK